MFVCISGQFVVGCREVFIHRDPLTLQLPSIGKHFVLQFPGLEPDNDRTPLARRGRPGPVRCFQILLRREDAYQVCEDPAALLGTVVGGLPGLLLHVIHPQVPSAVVLLLVVLVTENAQDLSLLPTQLLFHLRVFFSYKSEITLETVNFLFSIETLHL